MDVYDEDGKTLTREEIIRLGRGYLIGEDEPQVRCSKCGTAADATALQDKSGGSPKCHKTS